MAIHHPQTVKNPEKLEPAVLFDEVMPRLLKVAEKAAKTINAVYVFKLSGTGGGEWTVDLPRLEVRRGAAAKADLTLAMPVADFQAMMMGKLDAEAVAGRVEYQGRLALLDSFAALIRPADQ